MTPLGWLGILRLGLVQAALGAVVVLTTSTLNRVMVVELALPAALPGGLVALHYAVQLLRPRIGHGSDVSGRRTPWILGGMAVLALGGFGAALATAWMSVWPAAGMALAVLAFVLIGLGVGAAGTSLLALLAKRVLPERRGAAATIVWLMMIAGIVVTATSAGKLLDPFSPARLVAVAGGVSVVAFLVACLAVGRIEGRTVAEAPAPADPKAPEVSFRDAMAEVWAEPEARRFAVFVFVSMLAYSAQDLILEPFAGLVFGLTPGQSTGLAGIQHGGVLLGMALVALAGSRAGSLRAWTIGGCLASALALAGLVATGLAGPDGPPIQVPVFILGAANGAFAVAAIGSMMGLAGRGRRASEGVRMGLWGAAQAIAFGMGGLLGAVAVDFARHFLASPVMAYAVVFGGEALLFLISAGLAIRVGSPRLVPAAEPVPTAGEPWAAGLSGR